MGRKKEKKSPAPPRRAGRHSSASPPQGYRYLEHTGDIMIEAWGADFAGALTQAARAMFDVLGPARPKTGFEIEEKAPDREALVVYLLSAILSECDAREIVPCHLEVVEYDENAHRIRARVEGERRRARDAIKAVTFHELRVEEERTGWRIQVLLDV